MTSEHFLNTQQVAEIFSVQTGTANGWIRSGKFGEPMKRNGRWYISEELVNAYINGRHGDSDGKS